MNLKKELISRYKNYRHFLTSVREVLKNGYPAKKLTVIGITGTDGKTTTCHLTHHILQTAGKSVGLISTVTALFNNQKIDTGLHTTTPDATVLQPLIKKMTDQGVKYLVLETTSHGLDQHRVLGCNYSIGALTNITHEHLNYHQTFEKYRQAKGKLFKKVAAAILNKDDPSFEKIKDQANPKAKIVSYSLKKPALFRARNIKLNPSGMEFTLQNRRKKIKIQTKLIGLYNVSNILAAIAIARELNIDWLAIQKALKKFSGIKGRMEIIDESQKFTAIVDFAHTPNALENVLKTLNKVKKPGSKLITVFGCAGERDYLKRPEMGRIATNLADISIFTAEDPRHENLDEIINQMTLKIKKGKEVPFNKILTERLSLTHVFVRQPDRQKALNLGCQLAQPNDIVVVCGKGHEKSLAFGNEERPWSDQKAMKKAILRQARDQK